MPPGHDSPAYANLGAHDTSAPPMERPVEPFVSHAQNFEDVMLHRALRHIPAGRWIDIGAAEPEADSVTLAFYERGWSGINVEPLAGPFARLQAARPRDINLNVAVGATPGETTLFVVGEETGLSTLHHDLAELNRAKGWPLETRPVKVTTLAQICAEHVHTDLHFLKIDAEGCELDILRGADFTSCRPWIVLLEAPDPGGPLPPVEAWENEVLTPAGYSFAYFDGLNRFYLAREHEPALRPAFAAPPNVFDHFIRAADRVSKDAASALAEVATLRALAHAAQERADYAQSRLATAQAEVDAEQSRVAAAEARADHAQGVAHAAQSMLDGERARTAAAEARAAAAEIRIAELEDHLRQAHASAGAAAETTAAEAARQACQIANLKQEVARAAFERDGWAQELFETNRHAAQLVIARQTLIEDLARLQVHERWRVTQQTERDEVEAKLQTRIDAAEAACAEAAAAHANALRGLEAQAREIQQLQALHAAIRGSSSWRITWPLRAAARALRGRG